jgi:hypothetical protein
VTVAQGYSSTATVRRVPRPEALLAGLEPMEGTATEEPEVTTEPEKVPATTGQGH